MSLNFRLLYSNTKGLQSLLLLYFIILFLPLNAQDNDLKLLEQKIILEKEDSVKAQLFNETAFQLRVSNPKKALAYSNIGMELSLKSNYKIGLINSFVAKGLIYRHIGDFEKAIVNNLYALRIAELVYDTARMSVCYNNIGGVYLDQKNYIKAIEYFRKSIDIEKKIGNKAQISVRLNNLGAAYEALNKFDKAIEYYNEALIIEKSLNNSQGITYAMYGIGAVYIKMGFYTKAKTYLKKALEMAKTNGDVSTMSYCLFEMGNLYKKSKEPETAIHYYQQCINFSDSVNGLSAIKETFYNMALTYAELSDYKDAFRYFLKYNTINEKLNNSEISRKIAEINTSYEVKKINHEMDLLVNESLLQEMKLAQQRNLINYLLFTIILIISFFAIRYQKQMKKSSGKNEVINRWIGKHNDLYEFFERLLFSRLAWKIFLSILIFIYFMVIQPFNTNTLSLIEKVILFAVYGSFTLVVTTFGFIIIGWFNNFFRKRTLMIKYFIVALIIIWLLSLTIWVLNYLQGIEGLTIKSLLDVLLYIVIFSFIPLLLIFISEERIQYAHYMENIQIEPVNALDNKTDEEKLITLETDSATGKILLRQSDLICFEASDNYTAVYFLKDEKIKKELYRTTLKMIELQIYDYQNIIRCHKSYIINIDFLKKITGNAQGFKMHLRNLDFEIPVSRNFPKQLLNTLKENLLSK
jgi:tetratricopeptide (TPR) repeat protein